MSARSAGEGQHAANPAAVRRWGILAVAAIAAATLAGRPAGLGVTVVACAVFALAARPRNAWSAVWWLLAAALAAVATVRAADNAWSFRRTFAAAGSLGGWGPAGVHNRTRATVK